MIATDPLLPTSAPVDELFETVLQWPATRWRQALGQAAEASYTRERQHPLGAALDERRRTSVVLRDAVLSVEGLALAAWFTADAARTVTQLLPPTFTPHEHVLARELLTDAALALLARPALPTIDLAVLLAPFLPLHLSDRA
jgi:hypothetical protein